MKTLLSGLSKAAFFFVFIFSANASFSQTTDQNYSMKNASLVNDAKPYVQLDWTGNEKGVSYFVIERSDDGKNFKQAAIAFTGEDASFTDYKFRDKNLNTQTGSLYYRIGLVNQAKDVTYLPVSKIAVKKPAITNF